MSGMTIPSIPALPAGYVVQLSDLQDLAAAATFLLGKPLTKVIDEVGGVAVGTSPTVMTFSNALIDTDGMYNSSQTDRLTIQTPGYYRLRYGLNVGGGNQHVSWVTSTTGSNNPLGAGVTSTPYWAGYSCGPSGGNACRPGASGVWPDYLYAGDYLQVLAHCNTTGNNTAVTAPGGATLGGNFFSLEYVSVG